MVKQSANYDEFDEFNYFELIYWKVVYSLLETVSQKEESLLKSGAGIIKLGKHYYILGEFCITSKQDRSYYKV